MSEKNGFSNWWELGQNFLKALTDEKQQKEAEDAIDKTKENRGTKQTFITCVIITIYLDGIKCALANFISNGEASFCALLLGVSLH